MFKNQAYFKSTFLQLIFLPIQINMSQFHNNSSEMAFLGCRTLKHLGLDVASNLIFSLIYKTIESSSIKVCLILCQLEHAVYKVSMELYFILRAGTVRINFHI